MGAVSPDGVVEAIESTQYAYALGVQWHPELMLNTVPALYTDGSSYRLNPFWVKQGVVANFWQRLRTEALVASDVAAWRGIGSCVE